MKTPYIALCTTLLALVAVPASAQTRTWNFGDQSAPGSCGPVGTPSFGNVVGCTEQPSGTVTTLNVSAYASTGGAVVNSTPGSGTNTYESGALNYWGTGSGFGVYNNLEGLSAGSPNHSMDNSTNSGAIDAMLLSFTSAQVLSQVTLGWSGTDGDFQVLAYTGAAPFSTNSIAGKTAAQMLSGGWSLITTVNGAGGISTPDIAYAVNSSGVSASYWLISAYNSAFGGTSIATSGIDAIKVLAVTAMAPPPPTPGVPLPGTLPLAALALFAVSRIRCRSAVA